MRPRSKVLETSAVKEFRMLHKQGHFPGLGYVKKLSMNHHIETLADYFKTRSIACMNCCAECFGDRGLRKSIIPLRSTEMGRCSYCGSENVAVLAASATRRIFRAPDKRLPKRCGRQSFSFNGSAKTGACSSTRAWMIPRARDLLAEILERPGDCAADMFSPANDSEADRLSEWEKLRDELMYHNRFFPEANIDLKRLELLLSPLTLDADEVPGLWYRARIQTGETPFARGRDGSSSKTNCVSWPGESSRHSLSLSRLDASHCHIRNPTAHGRNGLRC